MKENSMFRYLLKYVGKYQVLTELTTDTNDFVRDGNGNIHPDYDELYIPCGRGNKIKHTYYDGVLAFFTTKKTTYKKVIEQFEKVGIKYDADESDFDFIIMFNAKDMSKVAKIVKPKTKGAKINPLRKRAGKKSEYEIPKEDMDKVKDIISILEDRTAKMQFTRKMIKEFDSVVKKKYKNADKEKEELGLTDKEYIHYKGMWNEYVKYLQTNIKKI